MAHSSTLSALLPALALFSLVSSITPGPNNIMLMSSGVNFGFVRTLPHMFGVGLGFTLMVALIGFGLAAIFAKVPVLLLVLKWVGGAYLIYLAVKIARSAPVHAAAHEARPMTFLQAAAFQWVNPKACIMAVTACSTYAMPDAYGSGVPIIAGVFGVINLPCISLWAGFGSELRRIMSSPIKITVFNYTMAALLVLSLYPLMSGR